MTSGFPFGETRLFQKVWCSVFEVPASNDLCPAGGLSQWELQKKKLNFTASHSRNFQESQTFWKHKFYLTTRLCRITNRTKIYRDTRIEYWEGDWCPGIQGNFRSQYWGSNTSQLMKCNFCHPPKNSLMHPRSWLVCCFGCFGGVQVTFQLCLDHLAEKQSATQPRTAQCCAMCASCLHILAPSAEVFCSSRRSFYPTPETTDRFVAETYAWVTLLKYQQKIVQAQSFWYLPDAISSFLERESTNEPMFGLSNIYILFGLSSSLDTCHVRL